MVKTLSVSLAVLMLAGCRGDGLVAPDVLTYSASSQVSLEPIYTTGPVPVLEVVITISNQTDRTLTFAAHAECGSGGLSLFSTPELSGQPAWASESPGVCAAPAILPSPLEPGQSRSVTIGGVIPASVPRGRYYVDTFLAVGAGDMRMRTVHVAAGTVTLTQ